MRFDLTTDFRNPSGSGKSLAKVYAEIIELFIRAETLGFGAAYIFGLHACKKLRPVIKGTGMGERNV
jgi:hypothetical protein